MSNIIHLWFNGDRVRVCMDCGFLFCPIETCTECDEGHRAFHTKNVGGPIPQQLRAKTTKRVFCQICEKELKTYTEVRKHQNCEEQDKSVDWLDLMSKLK